MKSQGMTSAVPGKDRFVRGRGERSRESKVKQLKIAAFDGSGNGFVWTLPGREEK